MPRQSRGFFPRRDGWPPDGSSKVRRPAGPRAGRLRCTGWRTNSVNPCDPQTPSSVHDIGPLGSRKPTRGQRVRPQSYPGPEQSGSPPEGSGPSDDPGVGIEGAWQPSRGSSKGPAARMAPAVYESPSATHCRPRAVAAGVAGDALVPSRQTAAATAAPASYLLNPGMLEPPSGQAHRFTRPVIGLGFAGSRPPRLARDTPRGASGEGAHWSESMAVGDWAR